MVISLNGLVARENGEEDWLPSEGWQEFLDDAKKYNNIVMGRETYELVQKLYKDYNFDSVETEQKVIVTKQSEYKTNDGYVIVHSPKESLEYLESKGMKEILLIGGGKLNSEFIKLGLVHELWITITPFILGKGRPFINPEDFDIPLELTSTEVLSKGRVKLKYKVAKYVH